MTVYDYDRDIYGRLMETTYEPAVPKKANPLETENKRIVEAVRWATKAVDAIHQAGGAAKVLDTFPDELIATMVRNSINLTHK